MQQSLPPPPAHGASPGATAIAEAFAPSSATKKPACWTTSPRSRWCVLAMGPFPRTRGKAAWGHSASPPGAGRARACPPLVYGSLWLEQQGCICNISKMCKVCTHARIVMQLSRCLFLAVVLLAESLSLTGVGGKGRRRVRKAYVYKYNVCI